MIGTLKAEGVTTPIYDEMVQELIDEHSGEFLESNYNLLVTLTKEK